MKKLLTFILLFFPLMVSAQVTVPAGGTGTSTVPNNFVLMGSSNALRLTAKNIFALTNTWTGVNTFSAGWVNSATSTGTFGINLSGGCFAVNSVCIGGASASSGADPFNHVPVYGQTTSATSTLIALTGSPFSLVASSTVNFVQASTTNIDVIKNLNILYNSGVGGINFQGSGGGINQTIWNDNSNLLHLVNQNAAALVFGTNGSEQARISSGGIWTWAQYTTGVLTTGVTGIVTAVATTSLSGSGVITVTAGGSVLGASPITVACSTCSTTLGTVTSITGGTGLSGGTITAAGTLALKSYLATSTADTANQISVFTSTNATPATFGGFTNFTFNSTSNLFTVINATTTNVSASQSLFVASKQVNPYQNATFAYGATSTTWAGTTTETTLVAPFSGILQDVVCVTDVGTLNVQAKVNSSNLTPMFNASTTKGTVTFLTNNTFVRGDTIEFDFGTPATAPRNISCTPRTTVSSF